MARAYPAWLADQLLVRAGRTGRPHSEVRGTIDDAVRRAATELTETLSLLLASDVDDQRANPLQVIREVTARAGCVLDDLGVPAPMRDEVEERAMPGDRHGLGPLAWRDLGDDVHEAGIVWGAWKAATVLARRRAEGKLNP